jgi:DNA-directed RNA polymerase subunit RPC12/RpoP
MGDNMNKITTIHFTKDNPTITCPNCGDERMVAYQCSCGTAFCGKCSPNSFYDDGEGDYLEITCPNCGATILAV